MRCVPPRPFYERHATALGLSAYVGAVILGTLGVATAVERFIASIFEAPVRSTSSATAAGPAPTRSGHLILTQDTWADTLRDPAFWASRKAGGNGNKVQTVKALTGSFWKPAPILAPAPQIERASLGVFTPSPRKPAKVERDDEEATYRTVCVRLCDGAFFPLSFATTRDHFEQDAAKCEKSCGSASRMFFYKNPGAEPEEMEDVDGRPYKKLATAFLYKTQYVEQCKCKPHPWEEAAVDRHKVYALEAAKAKGSKLADVPLKDLKAKMRQAELEAAAEKKRLAVAKIEDQKRLAAEAKASKGTSRIAAQQPAEAVSAGAPNGIKPTSTASLPPPPTAEPTAFYQPPNTSRPKAGTGTISSPTSAPSTGVVILRAGVAPQAKAVRITTPAPAANANRSWQPVDQR
jgi:Protein of unknown function (DUF2865)